MYIWTGRVWLKVAQRIFSLYIIEQSKSKQSGYWKCGTILQYDRFRSISFDRNTFRVSAEININWLIYWIDLYSSVEKEGEGEEEKEEEGGKETNTGKFIWINDWPTEIERQWNQVSICIWLLVFVQVFFSVLFACFCILLSNYLEIRLFTGVREPLIKRGFFSSFISWFNHFLFNGCLPDAHLYHLLNQQLRCEYLLNVVFLFEMKIASKEKKKVKNSLEQTE